MPRTYNGQELASRLSQAQLREMLMGKLVRMTAARRSGRTRVGIVTHISRESNTVCLDSDRSRYALDIMDFEIWGE